jgi:hypothetical protein
MCRRNIFNIFCNRNDLKEDILVSLRGYKFKIMLMKNLKYEEGKINLLQTTNEES